LVTIYYLRTVKHILVIVSFSTMIAVYRQVCTISGPLCSYVSQSFLDRLQQNLVQNEVGSPSALFANFR